MKTYVVTLSKRVMVTSVNCEEAKEQAVDIISDECPDWNDFDCEVYNCETGNISIF